MPVQHPIPVGGGGGHYHAVDAVGVTHFSFRRISHFNGSAAINKRLSMKI